MSAYKLLFHDADTDFQETACVGLKIVAVSGESRCPTVRVRLFGVVECQLHGKNCWAARVNRREDGCAVYLSVLSDVGSTSSTAPGHARHRPIVVPMNAMQMITMH